MNMLHFAGTREEQQQQLTHMATAAQPEIDHEAAQAALSSLPSQLAVDSTLVSRADVSDDEKLQALRHEEARHAPPAHRPLPAPSSRPDSAGALCVRACVRGRR